VKFKEKAVATEKGILYIEEAKGGRDEERHSSGIQTLDCDMRVRKYF